MGLEDATKEALQSVAELNSPFHTATLAVLPEGCLRRFSLTTKKRKVSPNSEECRYSVRCLTADNDWGHTLEFRLSHDGVYLSGPEISQPEASSEIFIRGITVLGYNNQYRDIRVLGYNNQYVHTPRWYPIQDQDKLAVQYGAGEILLKFNSREKSPDERQKSRGSGWRKQREREIRKGCPRILAWTMS